MRKYSQYFGNKMTHGCQGFLAVADQVDRGGLGCKTALCDTVTVGPGRHRMRSTRTTPEVVPWGTTASGSASSLAPAKSPKPSPGRQQWGESGLERGVFWKGSGSPQACWHRGQVLASPGSCSAECTLGQLLLGLLVGQANQPSNAAGGLLPTGSPLSVATDTEARALWGGCTSLSSWPPLEKCCGDRGAAWPAP